MAEQAAEPTRIACPECGTVYRVNRPAAELARARVKCKKCDATFTPVIAGPPVPAAPPAPAPAPPRPAAQAPAPSAPPAPAPAPPAAGSGGDPLQRLEDHVGELNRALYAVR
ncbi:MAG: MJ0042-type zinc finger domain-containing protein, partial [Nitrospinota bacterium]